MGKKMINEKLIQEYKLSIEGSLDIENLQEGQIKMEVEEIGEVDLKTYLDKFNGSYVKISISDKTEETVEEE